MTKVRLSICNGIEAYTSIPHNFVILSFNLDWK
jgi:hypothetical protein